MGLLNFLQSGWGVQQPQGFMPGEWDWMGGMGGAGGYGQQWPGGQMPWMQQPQQPPQQLPASVTANSADFGGVASPAGPPKMNFIQKLNAATSSPLFQKGLALMGQGQNGGDWSKAVQQWGDIDQQSAQAANQRFQQQIAMRNMQRQEGDWRQQDEQRKRWEAAVQGERDPTRKQQLMAIGPQGYGDFLLNKERMEFQARESQLDRDAQMRAASIRAANENSLGRYFQQSDAQMLSGLNDQSTQLQAVALPQLRNLRQTIMQAGTRLTGQPLDYNSRIKLGQLFNGSSEDRQTLEVWRARVLGPALETLRGLGAMSEREMEAAINSFSNPDMTLGASMALIDEKISTAERRVATANAASEFFNSAGGITGVRNKEGQDFSTFLSSRLADTPGAATSAATDIPRGGYPSPPPAAIAELRRDTSASARAEFDQTFGPGAAQRALSALPLGRGQQGKRGYGTGNVR